MGFVTAMTPKHLGTVMAEMRPEVRRQPAREMVERLVAVFQAELGKQAG